MKECSSYVGLDVHAATISVCALAGRVQGEEVWCGAIPATPEAVSRLIGRLGKRGPALYCYEAGPYGYGLHWQILESGHGRQEFEEKAHGFDLKVNPSCKHRPICHPMGET